MENDKIYAVLTSDTEPDGNQKQKFTEFLQKEYDGEIVFSWEKDDSIKNGFRLTVGEDVFDWTLEGRFQKLVDSVREDSERGKNIIPLLKENLKNWTIDVVAERIGTVVSVGDSIATVSGLYDVFYGEILVFEGGIKGMVQSITENECGCILFDDDAEILSGTKVKRTGKIAGISCSDAVLGRVTNALGMPIDGMGNIPEDTFRPLENEAPGIIERESVNKPLETGILAIDSMFPIGKGQRELIIGDRQTGKSSIAIDTIINQKGKDVICIYVSIGQKASFVSNLVETLKKNNALEYTAVISASASDPATMQYIAPYAGCSLGEYFMEKGKDVLIVYDDLSKHAVAYRSISLLLGRTPGREAYPGDVFYLHSRLLERSAHLSIDKGGGSMTALPIVETLAGDVSAYIPTNIISITDGQIFLESTLFYSGQRPAINVGLSVSRVGGNAQTPAMKKSAKTLRLDLAQYREMEIFMQFSSELDEETAKELKYGQGLMRMLRQKQSSPLSLHKQIIMLLYSMDRTRNIPNPEEINEYLQKVIEECEKKYPQICEKIDKTGDYTEEDKEAVLSVLSSVGE